MLNNRSLKLVGLLAVLVAVVISGYAVLAAPVAQRDATVDVLRFDVSEDMTRFVFDQDRSFEEDGFPAYGSAFITQGYIYPENTLDGSNGVLPDGSPEFPELVLGEWTCYGYFVNDGAHSTTGPMVITTQIFSLGEEYGANTIVHQGYELVDLDTPVRRAIVGGTGEYAAATGEVIQQMHGLNATEGVVLSFEVELAQ